MELSMYKRTFAVLLISLLAFELAGCAAKPYRGGGREGDFVLNLATATPPPSIGAGVISGPLQG